MLKFSSSKIVNYRFHFDNKKCESVIGYDMIIGRNLMVHIGLTANFKRQVLQWGVATVHIKEPSSLVGKYDLIKLEMCLSCSCILHNHLAHLALN